MILEVDKAHVEVTRDDFEAYEEVRESGVTNMFSSDVLVLADISRDVHRAIITNYRILNAEWPDVRHPPL